MYVTDFRRGACGDWFVAVHRSTVGCQQQPREKENFRSRIGCAYVRDPLGIEITPRDSPTSKTIYIPLSYYIPIKLLDTPFLCHVSITTDNIWYGIESRVESREPHLFKALANKTQGRQRPRRLFILRWFILASMMGLHWISIEHNGQPVVLSNCSGLL